MVLNDISHAYQKGGVPTKTQVNKSKWPKKHSSANYQGGVFPSWSQVNNSKRSRKESSCVANSELKWSQPTLILHISKMRGCPNQLVYDSKWCQTTIFTPITKGIVLPTLTRANDSEIITKYFVMPIDIGKGLPTQTQVNDSRHLLSILFLKIWVSDLTWIESTKYI